jgi:hypothetical protein
MKDQFKNIDYLLSGINPDNKLSVLWWEIKNRVKYLIPYKFRHFYYKHIKTIWKPQHSRIRKAVPKYWYDLDYVLLQVNFEIIKSFYEDEYVDGPIDWQADEKHKKFAEWLESAYRYITEERPVLQKRMDESYPQEDINFDLNKGMNKISYKKLYGQVEKYETLIHKTDTKILTELVKNRDFFWT